MRYHKPIFSNAVLLIYAWSTFASIAILIATKYANPPHLIFALRDIIIYILFLLLLPFSAFTKKSAYIIFILCCLLAYLIFNQLILNPGYSATINNIRQIIAPSVLLMIFYILLLNAGPRFLQEQLPRWFLRLHLIIFIWGILEYTLEFWKHFGLSSYFTLKGIPVDSNGLSYMFYEPILGYRLRMTSTFLDPISLGHYFATTFSIGYLGLIFRGKARLILTLSSLIGLLLSFSKGALLQAFLTILVLNPAYPLLLRGLLLSIPFAVFLLIPNKTGLMIHVSGFMNSLSSLEFFGHGIGSSGNYTKMFAKNLDLYHQLGISDTFLGSIMGQTGLLGIILWLIAMFLPVFHRNSKRFAMRFLAAIVAVSALSENTLNVTSFAIPSLTIVWLYFLYDSNPRIVRLPTSALHTTALTHWKPVTS